jgi:DNA repair protein RadB
MRLATGCAPIDAILGGGIEGGAITLVYGEAGTGKTNLCLQLSVQAVLSGKGKVAYVDTEGVSLERLHQIAGDDAPRILKDILFFTPQSLDEQERMIKSLDKIAPPALIVVDSLNLYYRLQLSGDNGQEVGVALTNIMGQLLKLSRNQDIPILVTGQVYSADEGPKAFGGKVMEHIVKAMLRFERLAPGVRRATVIKHRSVAEGAHAEFFLTGKGLAARPDLL